ncbi:uncharacterized protein UDID_18862 [Ustilago sp. UG-2017a]|nr:uncharacterized protein UDID_18862 [Ustilago sp. UG-2017a]
MFSPDLDYHSDHDLDYHHDQDLDYHHGQDLNDHLDLNSYQPDLDSADSVMADCDLAADKDFAANTAEVTSSVTDAQTDGSSVPAGSQEEAYVRQQPALDLLGDVQARLQGLHLALVDTPQLLVCTYPDCEHGIIFSKPTFKDILQHLKKHHQAIAPTTEFKLKVLLEELDLPLAVDTYIDPMVLPLPMIPGVELLENGHWCKLCGYTIRSNSANHKHFRMNPDHFRGKNNQKILMQVIYNCKGRKRFLYMHNKDLTLTPPPALPAAATSATNAMNPALCAKVDRCHGPECSGSRGAPVESMAVVQSPWRPWTPTDSHAKEERAHMRGGPATKRTKLKEQVQPRRGPSSRSMQMVTTEGLER